MNIIKPSRRPVLAAAALAALWALGTPAQAQSRPGGPPPQQRQAGPRGPAHQPPRPAVRRPAPPPRHAMPPHYADGPRFEVGRPLPSDYRGRNYRVDRWRDHRLPPPRRGQHWVQHGADYLLINAGGIVLQIVRP